MKNYIGVKIVKAEPMTKGEYEKRKGALSPLFAKNSTNGYLVRYKDGHEFWTPKEKFEEEYRELGDVIDFINEK